MKRLLFSAVLSVSQLPKISDLKQKRNCWLGYRFFDKISRNDPSPPLKLFVYSSVQQIFYFLLSKDSIQNYYL
jgi:hypothetical protein